MKEEIYYAIDSGNGYVRGLNVDGSLSLGGGNVIKNMSGNYVYAKDLIELIREYTDHEVSLKKITVTTEEKE
ncbi:hypothetical protein [Enterococcus faecium]|mgnify:CR=1 FL=1|uniref:hypothetical protein n=1 Tax=Enterococcus faecium TaxID=1352 RepID=UPI0001B6E550|nr:hypothetical protein [Enterococcus faecium]EEV48103.1 predicted protein [Enterococcus faecium 1,231,501]EGP5134662.1 hypothetical protein [Enterococcus faecium]KST43436.1 hypothetical protein AOY34_01260 [Enterococcus faecium]MDQ8399781.1 hypothetical protein [Enterococcus faecium]MDT6387144.1 hypothetical protein [Enterococcus faecium]